MIQYRVHGCIAQLKVSVWQWRLIGAAERRVGEVRVQVLSGNEKREF